MGGGGETERRRKEGRNREKKKKVHNEYTGGVSDKTHESETRRGDSSEKVRTADTQTPQEKVHLCLVGSCRGLSTEKD